VRQHAEGNAGRIARRVGGKIGPDRMKRLASVSMTQQRGVSSPSGLFIAGRISTARSQSAGAYGARAVLFAFPLALGDICPASRDNEALAGFSHQKP